MLLGVRWKLFLNSLRGKSRDFELIIQIVGVVFLLALGIGTSIGFYYGSVAALNSNQPWVLNIMLWIIFIVWQLAPVLFEGHSPGVNFREIARYPIPFRTYYFLNCGYGLLDPAAIAALLWLGSIWYAILTARPEWAGLAALVFLIFALLNVFCNRLVVALFDRFQSTRKGRERMVVVLLIVMLAPQILRIVVENWARGRHAPSPAVLQWGTFVNRFSPPGAAFSAFVAEGAEWLPPMLLLLAYTFAAAMFLDYRSRAVYQGEIYAEAHVVRRELKVRPGWKLPAADDAVSAIVEKELRYVRQNARLMVLLLYPFLVFGTIFFSHRSGPGSLHLGDSAVAALGFIAAIMLLSSSNLLYNIFGLDREGFGRWLLAPVPLKKVIAAKNLAQGAVIFFIYLLGAGFVLFLAPSAVWPFITMTIAFVAVLLVQFAVGNSSSAHWPKPIDLSRMSSKMTSNAAGFTSLAVTLPAGGLVWLVVYVAGQWELPWLPLAASLAGLGLACILYRKFLERSANYIQEHAEEIESALRG